MIEYLPLIGALLTAILIIIAIWVQTKSLRRITWLARDAHARRRERIETGAKQEQLYELLSEQRRETLDMLSAQRQELTNALHGSTEGIERRLNEMRAANEKSIEIMRATVDEKLQSTLNARISQSFRLVQERLEQVYKGLGEMQALAKDVGGLKKVLSGVKTRGILGEIQLKAILSEILTQDQYAENVAVKPNSREVVEFAVKMPGLYDNAIYLPIDAKFPLDAYIHLTDAYESGIGIEAAQRALRDRVLSFARDIREKYIAPPYTTEFAVMFLPTEGLYAEVLRLGMMETLQSPKYRVSIAGPTTMAALLNSLQMGFRTLALEKRSSEVWDVLGAVKTEFSRFEDVLVKAQRKLDEAHGEIDRLVGVRTRAINRSLKRVTELPEVKSSVLISDGENDEHVDERD